MLRDMIIDKLTGGNSMRHDVHTARKEAKTAGLHQHRPHWLVTCLVFLLTFGFSWCCYGAGGDSLPPHGWGDAQAGKQQATASVVDSTGNVIVTGYRNLTGGTNDDYWTVKFNSDGNGVVWRAYFDKTGGSDQAMAVAVDGNNDVVVTGYVWNGSNKDIHTIKYNGATGAVIWQHTFNSTVNGNDVGTSIAVDNVNNVYVGGYSQNASGNDDYIVLKYSSTYDDPALVAPIWHVPFDGLGHKSDQVNSIAAGANGVVVTGYSSNGATLDFVTVKYGPNGGAPLWVKRKSAQGDAMGNCVRMDTAGNVIVTGYASNGTNKNIYTAKYDATANNNLTIWEQSYIGGQGNDQGNGLYVDGAGDIYVTGSTWTLTGNNDFFTAKYKGSDGTLAWQNVQTFDSTVSGNANDDTATSLVVDERGDLFVTGYTISAGNSGWQTIKYAKDNGNLLWQSRFNVASNLTARPVGIGLSPTGGLLVAGWSDTADNSYDYYVVKYDPGLLNAPTGLVATTLTTTSVRLSWTDNADNEDGFYVKRCTDQMMTLNCTTIPRGPNPGTGIVTYPDTGLSLNTYYYYQVWVYNAANGSSYPSNTAVALTVVVTPVVPAWAYTYNGLANSDDYANAIAVGPDNNPVVTGQSIDFAPGYTSGNTSYDYLTMKLNRTNSNVLWSDRYNDPNDAVDIATCVAVDTINNAVTVSGYATLYNGHGTDVNSIYTIKYPAAGPPAPTGDQYNGPVATGATDDRALAIASTTNGSGNVAVVGHGKNAAANDDIYVVKYNPDGTRAWAATPFDGNGGDDLPTAVAFAPDGSIFVTGYSETAYHTGIYKFFTAKYNGVSGTKIWSDLYSVTANGDNQGNSLAVDASGDVYVTGSATTAAGNKDIYTIKYNGASATAQRVWERSFDGQAHGDDAAIAVKIDPVNDPYAGSIVVAGTTLSGPGDHDLTIIRYTPAGDTVWQRTLQRPANDDNASALGIDYNGNVYVAGNTSNGTTIDSFTVKYDYLGNYIGATLYNGTANGNDDSTAIAVNLQDEAFVAGYTENAAGNADYLVYKIAPDTSLPSVPYPFIAAPLYTTTAISWSDKSTTKSGYNLQRQVEACSSDNFNLWTPLTVTGTQTSYPDAGLPFAATYCYRVQTKQSSGATSRWNYVTTTTQTPPAPLNLSCSAANTTQVNCTWTDTTTGETSFTLERCTGAACDFSIKVTFPPIGANATSYNDTTASNNTPYRYRILASAPSWSTPYSDPTPPVITPAAAAPTNLTATRFSEAQINLSWTDNDTDESGYKVYRCTGTQAICGTITDLSNPAPYTKVGDLAANTTSFQNTAGLTPGPTYTYQVVAFKTATSGWSVISANPASASATTTDLAPSNLSCSANTTTQVSCSWSSNTSTQTGFQINRCNGDGTGCIIITPGNVSSYTDTTVCSAKAYTYQVRAIVPTDPSGYSPYSSTVSVTSPTPPPPNGLTATRISEVQINLAWTNNATDQTGYRVYRCMDTLANCGTIADPNNPPAKYVKVGNDLAATAVSFNDTGLIVNTPYTYQVVAFKNATCGWGVASTTAAGATTTIIPPSNPTATASLWGTCNDLRFTDSDGATLLSYWIESGCATKTTQLWVKVPSLPTGNKQLYLHYGNFGATSASSAANTFMFYDDFTGASLSSQWTSSVTGTGSVSVASGLATLDANGTSNSSATLSKVLTPPYIVESRVKVNSVYPATSTDRIRGLSSGITGDTGIFSGTYSYYVPFVGVSYSSPLYAVNFNGSFLSTAVPLDQFLRWNAVHTGGSTNSWSLTSDSGASIYSNTYTGTPTGVTFSVGDVGGSSFGNLAIDWVRARGYASPMPAYSLAQNVENGTYPLTGGTWHLRWPLTITNTGGSLTNYQVGIVADTTSSGSDQIVLNWTNNTVAEAGLVVERCAAATTGGNCDPETVSPVTFTTGPQTTTYTDQSVSPATTYCYRVKPTNAGWPNIVSAAVCATTSLMNPPTNLNATAHTTEVDLSWADNSTGESAFKIERCPGGSPCASPDHVYWMPSNATSYADTTDICAGTYTYHVQALKNGVLTPATPVDVTAMTVVPPAPTGLVATRVSEAELDLAWTSGTTDQTGFTIQRCQNAGCTIFSTIKTVGATVTTYKDTDPSLLGNTTYRYQVQANKTGSCAWDSVFSAPAQAVTTAMAPSNCTATAVSAKQINLAWTDNTIREDGFKVERCVGATCTNLFTTAPANATSYVDTPLPRGTTYSYRLRAYNSTSSYPWNSDYCTTAAATTSNLTISAMIRSATSIQLTWYSVTGATGYRIENYAVVSQTCGYTCTNNYDWVAVTTVGAGVTKYTITGLTTGAAYTYRVVPTNAGGDMTPTNQVAATPSATGFMSLTVAASGGNLNLSWGGVAATAGYRVERKTGSTGAWGAPVPPETDVSAGTTAYADTNGLALSTTYCYRVTAYDLNADMTQSPDDGICATTGGAPNNLTATPANTSEIDLAWAKSTSDESAFVVERELGSSCNFATKDTYFLPPNIISYPDTAACNGTTYCYRVKAVNYGLSQGGNSYWTRRVPLTITNFQPNFQTRVVVPYNAAMQANFNDIRFHDTTANAELPYWIENETDGVSATVWVKTGANNAIYLYYGNPGVSRGSSSAAKVFEFFDGFDGSALDSTKWQSYYSSYAVANGALQVNSAAVYTKTTVTANPQNRVFEMKAQWTGTSGASSGLTIANVMYTEPNNSYSNALAFNGTNGTNANLAPFGADGTSASYNIVNGPASVQTDPINTFRIVGFEFQGTSQISYFIKGLDYSEVRRNTYPGTWNAAPYLYLGSYQGSYGYGSVDPMVVDWVRVRAYAATEPTVAMGTEEYQAAGFTFNNTTYISPYSNTATAATPALAGPDALTAAMSTEKQATLVWTRKSTDETGFSIERCTGQTCNFSVLDFGFPAVVGSGVTTYNDTSITVSPATTYNYRVRAYKTATCNGYSPFSPVAQLITTAPAPVPLTGSAVNTTEIDLNWVDKTVAETAYLVERCAGADCKFSPEDVFGLPANSSSYADTGVCNGTPYNYRVKAINRGFLNSGNGCWSQEVPLMIANFQPNYQMKLAISYDAAMQANFNDIRFYDATAHVELPYWIEGQTSGSTATIWVKTGANNAIYLYYGNPAATSVSNGSNVFEFFDDFNGSALDFSKWGQGYYPSYTVANSTLQITANAVYSSATVTTNPQNRVFEMKAQWTSNTGASSGLGVANAQSTQANNAGSNPLALYMTNGTSANLAPWGADGTAASYNIVNGPALGQTDPINTYRIVGFAFQGASQISYFIKDLNYNDVRRNTYTGTWTASPYLYLGYYTGNYGFNPTAIDPMVVDWVRVRTYAATEPVVTLGAKQSSACFTKGTEYDGVYATVGPITTPTAQPPSVPVLTPAALQVALQWTDVNSDETGVQVERCYGVNGVNGANCDNLTTVGSLPAGTKTYNDPTTSFSTVACYKVTAFKNAACGWRLSSPVTCVTTFPAVTSVTATALNSLKIGVSWSEATNDQNGFEIEKQLATGQYVNIATVAANVTSFTDTKGIEPQKPYNYRVRAYRGTDEAAYGYSNTTTTPPYASGDNTCNNQLTVTASGQGTISLSPPGVSCPAAAGSVCSAYCSGAQVTLTALPSTGASFAGWSSDCTGTFSPCSLTIDTNKNVTGAFH